MSNIKTSDVRQSFIDYFIKNDHKQVISSPVIPFGDPTLLFANAGMNQFKDIFTGQKKPEFPRAVSVQKCMRAGGKHNDLENVGRTGRHHTFFEMLGNFSFGNYFKEEAIKYCWDYITNVLQLPKDRLYASVFQDDDEAFSLWGKIAPELKNGRILRFDEKENYWSMGDTGPNGPCSEVHFDRGEKFGTGPNDVVNGETERFVEIWNLVFMQFNTKPDGTTVPLPKPSVDTGAGLERLTSTLQGVDSNYEIDIFKEIIGHLEEISRVKYHTDERGVSHRVVADHVRALSVCLADGGGLSNEKQGYVLRRILRRAARHGRKLGIEEPFIWKLVPYVGLTIGGFYPEIKDKIHHIENVIKGEEESFGRTLDNGIAHFDNVVKKLIEMGNKIIPGDEAFMLYDTFGFPVDLTNVMAEEAGFTIDMVGFEKAMNRQKDQSRASGQFGANDNPLVQIVSEILGSVPSELIKTEFVRGTFSFESEIIEMFELNDGKNEMLAIIPVQTPFYVESGGQVGDIGMIDCDLFRVDVDTLIKYNDAIVHIGRIVKRNYKDIEEIENLKVKLQVDPNRRMNIMRNHTATHLLHSALRNVLGEHVNQSGSYVGPEKLRFDYSHFQPMTDDEIDKVERMVNGAILKSVEVGTIEDDLENAKKSGAMAIFGEKYGSKVRVVSVGVLSKELCGGTHVANSSQIGPFMITSESALASGVRRIEAVTGFGAVEMMLGQKKGYSRLEQLTGKKTTEVAPAVEETYEKLLELQKENKKLKSERFSSGSTTVGQEIKIKDITFKYHDFGVVEQEEMGGWVDNGKGAGGKLISAGVGLIDGKKTVMVSASSSVDIHIGKLSGDVLKEFGGRGGGKLNFARGSVPNEVDPQKVFDAFIDKLKD
ncbi:MAG: alanine--tRNA ligase [Candidatus Zixiibacteriota bacterium]